MKKACCWKGDEDPETEEALLLNEEVGSLEAVAAPSCIQMDSTVGTQG